MKASPATFAEFYPMYLAAHRRPLTRRLHRIGAEALAILAACGLAASINAGTVIWQLPAAGVVLCYGLAWLSHAFVEKNAPLTFRYPIWSMAAFWKMVLSAE